VSQQTVQVVEAGIQAFNRRDVEGFAELATEDFVWLPALPGAVEADSYLGHTGIRRYFSESQSTWEQLTVLCDELRDLDDSVFVLGRASGRGLGSGVEVETPVAFVIEFRAGQMSKVCSYLDHGAALEAVRLEE
jgi:ketosteroid isomerase-like protein